MTDYSHSRLQVFEQCPFRYKAIYIDHDFRVSRNVEGFMGDQVHQALRSLHERADIGQVPVLEELLELFERNWVRSWTDDVIINKPSMTQEDYKMAGKYMLGRYYQRYHPFDQILTVGLETDERLALPDGNRYYIRIDRLGRVDQTYYVCDYKTGQKGVTKQEAVFDHQLPMYALWVERSHKDADQVVMRWHSLATNQEVDVEAQDDILLALEQEIVRRISKIERTRTFPTKRSGLCSYCLNQDICPEFRGLLRHG